MNRRQALTGLTATAAVTVLAGPGRAAAAGGGSQRFPDVIQLPDNWLPEGITIGDRPFAYFGSRADGSIYRANLVTGEGRIRLVAVVRLSAEGRSGQVLGRVGSELFDVPTTVAKFDDRLYLPNARFGAVPPATFTAVAIPVPRL